MSRYESESDDDTAGDAHYGGSRKTQKKRKESRSISIPLLQYHDLSSFYKELAIGREERKEDHDAAAATHEEFQEAEHNAEDIIDSMTRILAPIRRKQFFQRRMHWTWRLIVDYGQKCLALRMADVNHEKGMRGSTLHLKFFSLMQDFKSKDGYEEMMYRWKERAKTGKLQPRTRIQKIQALTPIRLQNISAASQIFHHWCRPYLQRRFHYSARKRWYEKLLLEQQRARLMENCDYYRHGKNKICSRCGADFVHGQPYFSTDVLSQNTPTEATITAESTAFPERVPLDYAKALIYPLVEHAGQEAEESLAYLILMQERVWHATALIIQCFYRIHLARGAVAKMRRQLARSNARSSAFITRRQRSDAVTRAERQKLPAVTVQRWTRGCIDRKYMRKLREIRGGMDSEKRKMDLMLWSCRYYYCYYY